MIHLPWLLERNCLILMDYWRWSILSVFKYVHNSMLVFWTMYFGNCWLFSYFFSHSMCILETDTLASLSVVFVVICNWYSLSLHNGHLGLISTVELFWDLLLWSHMKWLLFDIVMWIYFYFLLHSEWVLIKRQSYVSLQNSYKMI